MSKINWKEIQEKLSYQMNADAKKKRDTLFKDFDTNGNGFLSLAEIDKGIQDFLKLPEVFDVKSVIMQAFMATKDFPRKKPITKNPEQHGGN